MKKRIILLVAIAVVFGLTIAAYAYTRGTTTVSTAACCCKKDAESCPMKGKDDKSDHAGMSCCKKHGDDHAKGGDHSKAEGHSCCGCCGDSCPMKKGEGKATTVSASADGKSCCDNCECCKGKTKTSV